MQIIVVYTLKITFVQGHVKIFGHVVDCLKLQSAKLNSDSSKCALQLMSCLFSIEEMVNGNPSGVTNSKDEGRRNSIRKLDPNRINYVRGNYQRAR